MSAPVTGSPPRRVILIPPARSRARPAAIAGVALIAAAALWIAGVLIILPRRDTLPNPAPRVVIALGAGVRNDSTLNSASVTRLETAIAYARAHDATIVTTRAFGSDGRASDRAQRGIISSAGLADRWIALPNNVTNTRDEAMAMHMVIADTQPVVVVTSPLHTRRACATFERIGYRVTCLAAAQYDWWQLPYAVAYESAAYVKYKARGWW